MASVPALADEPVLDPPPVGSLIAPLANESTAIDALVVRDDADRQIVVAVGDRGHVLRSRDLGKSWEQSQSPVSTLIGTIDQAPSGRLLAAGHDAVIMISEDKGLSWDITFRQPEWEQPILDLRMLDDQRGFAIGAYGLYLETQDGGDSWEQRYVFEGDSHLYDSIRLPDDTLIIVGEFGTILRSRDMGENWEELTSPYGGTFFGMLAPPADAVGEPILAFGLQGNVFASNDQGDSWRQIETNIGNGLYGGVWATGRPPVLIGHGGMLLFDDDAGPGFDWRPVVRSARKPLAGGLMLPDDTLLIFGETGLTRLTADGRGES
ncbi:MAG: YCF48-related protein [Pseudomonadota bacterium]